MENVNTCALQRYASDEMERIFDRKRKYRIWRRLWIYLAESQKELGLDVTDEQIDAMKSVQDQIPFNRVRELEEETRHEVMAHIRAFGEQCPEAAPIIHLGATSMYVMDNADLIRLREGLRRLGDLLANVVDAFATFCEDHADVPVLGLTHLQPAQVTTVGKRACLWLSEFVQDLERIRTLEAELPFRGVKGAVGTQDSYLTLFDGDHEKVKELDRRVAEKAGFDRVLSITGQTYSRKHDSRMLALLSSIAQTASKFAVDVRLLQSRGELQEPTKSSQVGSSAMAYKTNPVRTERISGLARYVIEETENSSHTAANQWMERSLDDSSNRRLVLPHAFLALDGVLKTVLNCAKGLVLHREEIRHRLEREGPFLATETILMEMVRHGENRQEIHERIRRHSRAAEDEIEQGGDNDLFERLRNDEVFEPVHDRLDDFTDPSELTGRSADQVKTYLEETVRPILRTEQEVLGESASLDV